MKSRASIGLALLLICFSTLNAYQLPDGRINPINIDEFGAADLILNFLLFLPFGWSLRSLKLFKVAALSLLLSLSVESAQFFLPGRFPSLSDLIFNTLGGAFGALLAPWLPQLLRPSPKLDRILCLLSGLLLGLSLLLSAWLLSPAPPHSSWHLQWTPNLGHLARYRGELHSAELDTQPLPQGPIHAQGWLREQLFEGGLLKLQVQHLESQSRLAPIFSIYDGWGREVFLLGAQEDDLVLRYWTQGARFRFNRELFRLRGALKPGSLELELQRRGQGFCLRSGTQQRCDLGPKPESGWALLLPGYFHRWGDLLEPLWLLLLLLPLGYYGALREKLLALALAAPLIILASREGLLSPSLFPTFVALVSLFGGVWLRRSMSFSPGAQVRSS